MTAFYNEIDPAAALWLEELIRAGEIAPGVVDRRDIRDIRPDELREFTQCHFFAGIGGWSLALRLAGWPDDRPVWTGSCPCQPFSAAGKGDGFADERHLWPYWHWLVEHAGPKVVFFEQAASKDGLGWLDLVCADLEGTGYAVRAEDRCAAGFGAPHIRQRLWGRADRVGYGAGARPLPGAFGGIRRGQEGAKSRDAKPERSGATGGLEHGAGDGRIEGRAEPSGRGAASGRGLGRLADRDDAGLEGRWQPGRERAAERPAGPGSVARGLADTNGRQPRNGDLQPGGQYGLQPERGGPDNSRWPRPTDGFWRDADWLLCRDGKWRPVEPGLKPLAHGVSGRVGLVRGYGNAIVPQVAAAWIAETEAPARVIEADWPDLLTLMEAAE